jgi:hypothetical protein
MTATLEARLSAPFAAHEVKWKVQAVKGNRAMIVPYVDARVVAERLDEVFGVGGWEEETMPLPDGSAHCKLSVWIDSRKVCRSDVGSPSEQPDAGDRLKASFSDALKRAAVKFGVGRYLYTLPKQWVEYSPERRQVVGPLPKIPTGPITAFRSAFAAAENIEELKAVFAIAVAAKDEAKAKFTESRS